MTEVESRIMSDNRALLAALELSMLNLNNTTYSTASPDPPNGLFDESPPESPLCSKKSQNITQCVSVPTSEHVAEIVGRQGCKIKALRAKTNTYIKTPVRGEEPVFIITGRPEDVSVAKKEILQAAEHFSQIRASRRNSSMSPPNVGSTPVGAGEKITIFVRVPYRVVGLVVGPKGATVKRIQQNTGTYIITPSRDMEPYFEVRGTPENVELAKKEIESYIVLRTGGADHQLLSPISSAGGLLHCCEPTTTDNGLLARRNVRRTLSTSVTPTTTLSETMQGGKHTEQRNSPLSSAVFSSTMVYGADDEERNYRTVSIPMSAPAVAYNKVFDFGGSSVKQIASGYVNGSRGSWSPQPSTNIPQQNGMGGGSWTSHLYNKAPSPRSQSPSGSWGELSPQPPSPTGSWGSNSSEGTAVVSPRGFPMTTAAGGGGFMSPQGYSRLGLLQQLRKTNMNGFVNSSGVCCFCEESEADTILVPCGHKTTCFECACKMSTTTTFCPTCSTKIESLARQQIRS